MQGTSGGQSAGLPDVQPRGVARASHLLLLASATTCLAQVWEQCASAGGVASQGRDQGASCGSNHPHILCADTVYAVGHVVPSV